MRPNWARLISEDCIVGQVQQGSIPKRIAAACKIAVSDRGFSKSNTAVVVATLASNWVVGLEAIYGSDVLSVPLPRRKSGQRDTSIDFLDLSGDPAALIESINRTARDFTLSRALDLLYDCLDPLVEGNNILDSPGVSGRVAA